MMRRVAQDPVGQTVCFELVMRLFVAHVLGASPSVWVAGGEAFRPRNGARGIGALTA